jgi:hypothetical protein
MKKLLIVFALIAILATGTVFAEHPDGTGVGGIVRYDLSPLLKGEGTDLFFGTSYGLSLKLPSIPVYWSAALSFSIIHFGVSVTGDYYFVDSPLIPNFLDFYLGAGGYLDYLNIIGLTFFGFGVRVPAGISIYPTDKIEIFLGVAPSLGLFFSGDPNPIDWKIPIEVGVRFWF